jgi:hypothetical protein
MGSVAAAMVLAAGQSWNLALGMWLVLAMRGLAAIYYARTQVMRARGTAVSFAPAYTAEILAVGLLALGAFAGLLPWLSVLALGLLLPWSVYTFARPPVRAKVVGWTQMAFGLLVVISTGIGVRL